MVKEVLAGGSVRRVRSPFLYNYSNRRPNPDTPTPEQMRAYALNEMLRRKASYDTDAFCMYTMRDSASEAPFSQQWFHSRWHQAAEIYNRLFIMSPRSHGKTCQISVGRVLSELGRNPNLRIKVVAQSDDKASLILQEVAAHIIQNPRVLEVFPNLKPMDKGSWSKHRLMVQRSSISKDPSLEALGILSSATGGRADLIIFDDIVDFRNAIQQPALREVVKNAYYSVWINLLEPEGRVVYVCIPPDSLLTTIEGPKEIQNINIGEQVLTGKGRFRAVKQTFKREYEGDMVFIKAYYSFDEIGFTPNHTIPIYREDKFLEVPAEQVRVGDYVSIPRTEFPKQEVPHFRGFEGDPDFYYFIGFWLAEGIVSSGTQRKARIGLCLGENDFNQEYFNRLLSIIRNKFNRGIWFSGKRKADIVFSFKELRTFLINHFGRYSYGKYLPMWVYSLTDECIIELLEGYFDGDGCRQGNKVVVTSISKELILGVWELLFHKFGILSGASHIEISEEGKTIEGNHIKAENISQSYALRINELLLLKKERNTESSFVFWDRENNILWKRVREINIRFYKGYVHNIEVEEDHTYTISGHFSPWNCTPWHKDDLTHDLLASEEYHVLQFRIEDDLNNPGHFISIWEDKWPDEKLIQRRNEIGPREFDRQFKMVAISAEEQLFTPDVLKLNYVEQGSWPPLAECSFYAGLDLAAFRKKNKDDKGWNSIFIIGKHNKTGKRWPFEIIRFRAPAPDVVRKFYTLWTKYQMHVSNVENNAYQQSLIEWIKELYDDSRFVNQVQAHTTSSNKSHPELGLPGLAMEFETRQWCIPIGENGHHKACNCPLCHWLGELMDYPIGRTFDVGMSSWFAQSALKTGSVNRGRFDSWNL